MTPSMISEKELRELFASVDTDGSGGISIDELVQMVWGKDRIGQNEGTQSEVLKDLDVEGIQQSIGETVASAVQSTTTHS